MLALAVRAGIALRLGSEDESAFRPFELELRRRLWCCIALLDTQATLDRGTAPMLLSTAVGPLPLNINDCAMSITATPRVTTHGFTEMSFSLLIFESMLIQKRICETSDWDHKLQLISAYEQMMQQNYLENQPITPLETLAGLAAKEIMSNMQLLMRRPPYKQHNNIPPSDSFQPMEVSTRILEGHLALKTPELSPWAWKEWVPWYALAVVLAELCRHPNGVSSDRAYAAAEEVYKRSFRPSTDSESGMLWKPIAKLMRRVQRDRQRSSGSLSTLPSTVPSVNLSASEQGLQNSSSASDIETTFGIEHQDNSMEVSGDGDFVSNGYANSASMINEYDLNMNLYNDLDPANGVSWLNWDLFLEDTEFPSDQT